MAICAASTSASRTAKSRFSIASNSASGCAPATSRPRSAFLRWISIVSARRTSRMSWSATLRKSTPDEDLRFWCRFTNATAQSFAAWSKPCAAARRRLGTRSASPRVALAQRGTSPLRAATRWIRSPRSLWSAAFRAAAKSTVARTLHHRFGFAMVSSDRTRKKLAAIPLERHADDAYKAGIYTDAITESTYAAMHRERARPAQERNRRHSGWDVPGPGASQASRSNSPRARVKILFIECRAGDAEIRRRLMERQQASNNPSDATVEVYLRQRQDFVPLSEIPAHGHLNVSTARPVREIVSAVKNAMEQLSR